MDLSRTVRIGWGACLLAVPTIPLAALGAVDDRPARAAARLLGTRHLLIGLMIGRRGRRRHRGFAAFTDAAHAASMVALARADRRRKRVAVADTVIASTFLLTDLRG